MATYDFNGADTNPLPDPPFKAWGSFGTCRQLSNQAANSAGSDTDSAFVFTTSTSLRCIIRYITGVTDGGPGCCINFAAGTGYFITSYDGATIYCFRVDSGGSFVQLPNTFTGTYAASDILEIERVGNDIVVRRNGVQILSNTDTTYMTGSPGGFMYAGTLRLDDLSDGVSPPAAPLVFDRALSRDNRPGRGPYSLGLFFRPSLDVFRVLGQTIAIGLCTESNTALTVGRSKVKLLGLNTEADTSLTVTKAKLKAIGLTTEADIAQPIAHRKSRTLGLNTESDSALGIVRAKLKAIELTTEADTALAMARSKSRLLGLVNETDFAFPISSQGQQIVVVGLATESDQALSIAKLKLRLLSTATESDQALGIAKLKRKLLGMSVEASTALAMVAVKGRMIPVGLVAESDQALGIAKLKLRALGFSTELDEALPFVLPNPITQAVGSGIFDLRDGTFVPPNFFCSVLNGDRPLRAAEPWGLALCRFGFADLSTGTVANFRTRETQRLGFVGQRFAPRNEIYLANGLRWIRPGYPATLYSRGDFWCRFPGGALRGERVYASTLDGAPISGYTLNALPTSWTVVRSAAPNELTIITSSEF